MLLAAGAWLGYIYYGRDESDFILRAGTMLALGAVVVCLLLTLLGAGYVAWWLRTHRDAPPVARSAFVGSPFTTDFRCPALRWWPLIKVRVAWLTPGEVGVDVGHQGPWLTEEITPYGRGRHQEVVREITVGDVLGLTAIGFVITRAAALRVAPSPGGADLTTILRQTSGEALSHPEGEPQGEYIEMRRYQPGDPMRLIVWKAYARSRRLLVRQPERAISPTPSAVAAMVAGPGDEPSASVARMFLEQGLLGVDFVFTADGAPRPVDNAGEAVEAIIDSAHHRDDGGRGLESLLSEVPPAQLGRCLIFAPGAPGPWLDRVAHFIGRLPGSPTLVLSVDDVPEPPPTGVGVKLKRWLVDTPDPAEISARRNEGLPSVYRRLEAAGARVIVLHRPSGRALGLNQLEAFQITPGATAAAVGA